MANLFVIQNQHGHYLSKQKAWTDGSDRRILYRTDLKDEAINTVFELSSRDVELRASYLECESDNQGNPVVSISDTPLPVFAEPESDEQEGADDKESSPTLETQHD